MESEGMHIRSIVSSKKKIRWYASSVTYGERMAIGKLRMERGRAPSGRYLKIL